LQIQVVPYDVGKNQRQATNKNIYQEDNPPWKDIDFS
jgi:hypothetical protein